MITDLVYVAIGYCIAVIFPTPFISSAILAQWGKIGVWLKAKLTKS